MQISSHIRLSPALLPTEPFRTSLFSLYFVAVVRKSKKLLQSRNQNCDETEVFNTTSTINLLWKWSIKLMEDFLNGNLAVIQLFLRLSQWHLVSVGKFPRTRLIPWILFDPDGFLGFTDFAFDFVNFHFSLFVFT